MNNKEVYESLKEFRFKLMITISQFKDTFYKDNLFIDVYFSEDKMCIRDKNIPDQNQFIYNNMKPKNIDELKSILIKSLLISLELLKG